MKPSKGYYSIIQYCPDLGRLEAANVGVLLFCPERSFLRAMMSRGNRRVSHFFGPEGHDLKRINSFKRGLQARLQREASEIRSVDDLRQFIAQRANQLQLTEPLPMRVTDEEADMQQLYERVVGETPRAHRPFKIEHQLHEQIVAAGLESRIVRDVTVEVPTLKKDFKVPFGFQNGRFNLIRPVRFTAGDPEQAADASCKYAVVGNSLYRSPDPKLGELQLIVVGQFQHDDKQSPHRVRRVLDEFNVRLLRDDEIPSLIEEIRTTAKTIA